MRATLSASQSPAGPTRSRFALVGRSRRIDPRVDPARRDLADVRVADRIFAPHYAAAVARTAVAPAAIHAAADPASPAISEILPGERFEMLELATDYAWGVCAADGAVGYVAAPALAEPVVATHVVTALTAPVHAEPTADAPVLWSLPMGARVTCTGTAGFRAVPGGYLSADALRPIADPLADPVAVAERLVGVPAKPGGRSGAGVDAAGLVFLAFTLAGYLVPRFCDLQASELGRALDAETPMRRGDLIFFDDHVALLADAETAIHVTADAVRREPLEAVLGGGHGAVAVRRRVA